MKNKAIFLFVVFMLNTFAGFSCALRMKMVHHDQSFSKPLPAGKISADNACCKASMGNLITEGDLMPDAGKVQVPVIWLADLTLPSFICVVSLKKGDHIFIDDRPPSEDIRIVIQSFQL